MARADMRHPASAPGPWFVDDRCIDCDAARQVAPGLIARNPGDGVSVFTRQPATDEEIAMAWRAVQVCPTRSVGNTEIHQPPPGVYPHDLGDGVHRLGHNAESSFGAHSYLLIRDGANVMVDSPRWTRQVVEPVEALGGIDAVLLTHRDDVADANRYAEHFGARVWIHADDRGAAPYATDLLIGTDPVEVVPGVIGFPVPGHTRGSVLWHVDGHLLFSGDSLAWSPTRDRLTAFRGACWYEPRRVSQSLRETRCGSQGSMLVGFRHCHLTRPIAATMRPAYEGESVKTLEPDMAVQRVCAHLRSRITDAPQGCARTCGWPPHAVDPVEGPSARQMAARR